jgi:hypothetical protein
MGSREQALIREFPNGETHLRSLLLRRGASTTQSEAAQAELRVRTGRLTSVFGRDEAVFGPTEIKRRYLFSEYIGE